jgi:uncharacterized protein DUF1996
MSRWLLILILLLAPGAVAAGAVAAGPQALGEHRHHGGVAYFAIACGFSHRNHDDPIVFPNQPGRSHDHTYFGNRSTNAASTPASLGEAGRTSCRLRADTAAYWAPTLLVAGNPVEPRGAIVFYVRRTSGDVQPFPPGLRIIAGNAAARSAQSQTVTSWSCGRRSGVGPSSTIPTCPVGSSLRLQVNFPNCWDGSRLDSADHKSHMAYSTDGRCPASHPVGVPALSIQIVYPVSGGATAELSSGGQLSGHADFVNAWDQRTLAALVDRYLNRLGYRNSHGR